MQDRTVTHPQSAEMATRNTKGFDSRERVFSNCISKLKDQDKLGASFVHALDSKTQEATSLLGSIFSIMIFCVTMLYTSQKLEILINKKDVDILSAKKGLVFTDDHIFDNSKGFNIAAAFTEYNSNTEWELLPEYGSLVINSYQWGTDSEGKPFTKRSRHPSHVCKEEELNLNGKQP